MKLTCLYYDMDIIKTEYQNQDIERLIVRYMQGGCTKEDRRQLMEWLNTSEENESAFFQMKEIFDSRQRIRKAENNKRFAASRRRSMSSHNLSWIRYAAIIAVLFGSAFIFYLLNKTPSNGTVIRQMVVHNTRGVYPIILPDGSRVWLHGGTTLTYPEQFTDSIRQVDLQGEAYFVVQADVNHPFVVQTSTAKVRATGTEFNVTAYPKDMVTTTTLVKGVVNIHPNHAGEETELKPGQQALVPANSTQVQIQAVGKINSQNETISDITEQVIVQSINPELFVDWKDGIYRFRNEPFRNIVLRLEKMYGISIKIESADLGMTSFSGMFTTDYSLKEALDIINISNPILFRVEDKVLYIKNK